MLMFVNSILKSFTKHPPSNQELNSICVPPDIHSITNILPNTPNIDTKSSMPIHNTSSNSDISLLDYDANNVDQDYETILMLQKKLKQLNQIFSHKHYIKIASVQKCFFNCDIDTINQFVSSLFVLLDIPSTWVIAINIEKRNSSMNNWRTGPVIKITLLNHFVKQFTIEKLQQCTDITILDHD